MERWNWLKDSILWPNSSTPQCANAMKQAANMSMKPTRSPVLRFSVFDICARIWLKLMNLNN